MWLLYVYYYCFILIISSISWFECIHDHVDSAIDAEPTTLEYGDIKDEETDKELEVLNIEC